MSKYRPSVDSFNLWPQVGMRVGSPKHVKIIDEIANILGPIDEERLLRYYQAGNYEDSARILGIDATTMALWFRAFSARANRCPKHGCCGRR